MSLAKVLLIVGFVLTAIGGLLLIEQLELGWQGRALFFVYTLGVVMIAVGQDTALRDRIRILAQRLDSLEDQGADDGR